MLRSVRERQNVTSDLDTSHEKCFCLSLWFCLDLPTPEFDQHFIIKSRVFASSSLCKLWEEVYTHCLFFNVRLFQLVGRKHRIDMNMKVFAAWISLSPLRPCRAHIRCLCKNTRCVDVQLYLHCGIHCETRRLLAYSSGSAV